MNEGDWRHWPKLEDGESLDLWNRCLKSMDLAENWTAVNAALMESAISTGTGEPIKEALLACRAIANALPKPEFDCVVMTKEVYRSLCDHIMERPADAWQLDFRGLLIITCEDAQSAKALAIALSVDGRRPMLVVSDYLPNGGDSETPDFTA